MEKVISKKNALDLDLYISGVPDLNLMDEADFFLLCSTLEKTIVEQYEKYVKRKKYNKPG